uniref:Uncharacterized protein n=1 Tax=Rhizophora mucronata TaxID=61149 RepID=A0A2P2Q2H9_RHIMU
MCCCKRTKDLWRANYIDANLHAMGFDLFVFHFTHLLPPAPPPIFLFCCYPFVTTIC